MTAITTMTAVLATLAGPMEQFEILDIIHLDLAGVNISFTNASLWMLISVVAVSVFMFAATNRAQMVPGKMQSAGESLYQFIADMLRDACGSEGMRFFPYIFTLFMFIFSCNLLGLWPTIPGLPYALHTFTPTSHIIVTFALAMVTITILLVYGFYKNGIGFLKLFVPSGVPWWLLWLIPLIEIVSFISRPISLAIRLFANMLAGHMILKIFAGFITALLAAGPMVGWLAIFPFLGNVALFLLELLVAFLQAYVFAILSSVYLNDALHPSH
ncbi:F0F1 ATP synthase subunit A [Aquisalinus flavus]|nr:F0F1 ATP synthase subunit A [Aquisalinus flavus]